LPWPTAAAVPVGIEKVHFSSLRYANLRDTTP
jgi:uncharacterized protein YbdZ (MbtH family)